MTAQERKEKIEAYLKSINVPINSHLPSIEEEEEAVIRSGQDIAKRLLILTYLNVVEESGDKKEITTFLKKEGLWDDVSEDEKELLKKSRLTKQDKIGLSWRSEGIWLMLWAINKVDELELPTKQCKINEILSRLPSFLDSTKEFVETATVRPTAEILDMADLIYRMHWSTRQASLDGKGAPADLDDSMPFCVYEFTCGWLPACPR
jgi:hypothetical protein